MKAAALVAAAFWVVSPAVSSAQGGVLPMLYDVVGVARGGAVNVRQTPDNAARAIGLLPADASGVEVVETDRFAAWARVNLGERSGWIAMRFLRRQPEIWVDGGLPRGLTCFGDDPSWSLRRASGGVRVSIAEDGGAPIELDLPLQAALAPGGGDDPSREIVAGTEDAGVTAILAAIACQDAGSERQYALRADVVLERQGEADVLRGCCTVAP